MVAFPKQFEPYFATVSGRHFHFLNPQPTEIDLYDIATALSNQCRFAGHMRRFYSVAEHSVRVSLACEPGIALWGLLHDASEAYICDIPSPVKGELASYRNMEGIIQRAIANRFCLSWPIPKGVFIADQILLVTEAQQLIGHDTSDWGIKYPALEEKIEPWTPEEARNRFMARFKELTA